MNDLDVQEMRKNVGFTQFYDEHLDKLSYVYKADWLAGAIFMFLVKHMDNQNAVVCSYKVLMDNFEKSRMTIYRAIKILEDNNFVKITKVGTANAFSLNSELVWRSWNNKKQYAKFTANVIVSKDEQIAKKSVKSKKITTLG